MRIFVSPALAPCDPDDKFEWEVGSDWDECSGVLVSHFDEHGWPYKSGDLIIEVEGIDRLDSSYERETAARLVEHYKGRGLDYDDVGSLAHVLHGVETSWGTDDCAIALRAAESCGWSISSMAEQADDSGWTQSAASTEPRNLVESMLEADGDSCPEWILDNIDYGFVDGLDFVSKVSLAGETYYVYLND